MSLSSWCFFLFHWSSIFFLFSSFWLLWFFIGFFRLRNTRFRRSWSWLGRDRTSFAICIKWIKIRPNANCISLFSKILLDNSWNRSSNVNSYFVCFNSSNNFIGIYEISWVLDKLFNYSFRYWISHSWNFNNLLRELHILNFKKLII